MELSKLGKYLPLAKLSPMVKTKIILIVFKLRKMLMEVRQYGT
jgi:hypothetical protein